MIEKEKSLLQNEAMEKVSKKPLSDEELSSLIKASNNSKFNEIELKLKKSKDQSFKRIALHDVAKQINQQKKEKTIEVDKNNNLSQSKASEKEKEDINEKKDENENKEFTKNNEDINKEPNTNVNNDDIKVSEKKNIDEN